MQLILLQALSEYLQSLSLYEVVGTLTGIAGVWLAARQNIWTWPLGLISVVMSVVVFLQARLYADVGLNIFYACTSVYGWYYWLFGGDAREELPVTRAAAGPLVLLLLAGAVFTGALGYTLDRFTNADMAYLNAGTTAVSLIAYYLLARKFLQNWVLWVAVDTVYIGMYFYKGLYLFAGLFCVYLVLSCYGFLAWRKDLLKNEFAQRPDAGPETGRSS